MCISGFVVDGSADVIARNAQIDIQERKFSFRDCMCELQSGMKIENKGNVLFLQVQRGYNTRCQPHRRCISCVAEVLYQCSVDRFVLLRILQEDTRNLGPFCCPWPPLPLDGKIRC